MMRKILLLSAVFFSSLSFGVPIYVDMSFDSGEYGISPGSEWVFYLSQDGYSIPSGGSVFRPAQDGIIDPISIPVYDNKGAIIKDRGTFSAGPGGSVVAFKEIEISPRELRTFPCGFVRIFSSTNLQDGYETSYAQSLPETLNSGATVGGSLSNVPLSDSVQYAPPPPAGFSGYISPVVQSLTSVPGSHTPLIVSVAVGFVVLFGAYIGIRLLSRAPKSVRGKK